MANPEHLDILRQGADVWNEWRKNDPKSSTDLTKALLPKASLRGANLFRANLNGAILSQADLTGALLINATLIGADLRNAILNNGRLIAAGFTRANLRGTKLIGADLRKAFLGDADLREADLSNANLSRAMLLGANFNDSVLDDTNFDEAQLGDTIFANVSLAKINRLEKVLHRYASIIGSSTMQLSKGKIPIEFLRGAGLSDWEIESAKLYDPELNNHEINQILYEMYNVRAEQVIQISPLFISYSHADSAFVDRLSGCLYDKGIRFWRDVNHATAGRLETQIDRAMRLNPTVLLILSEHSLKSDWVEHEVRTARGLEKEFGHDILCPVTLDESWKSSRWPHRLMEQITEYNILNFSSWKNEDEFNENFQKLIQGLDLFYK
jgi:uncharacterized protein YjbI with pentapeptide repeats